MNVELAEAIAWLKRSRDSTSPSIAKTHAIVLLRELEPQLTLDVDHVNGGDVVEAVTREAIRRVARGTDPEWRRRADMALARLATTRAILTPDDLWDVVERPREPRASGPVWIAARKRKWIEPTGRLVRSRHASQHKNAIAEYRSLVFGQDVFAVFAVVG